MDDNRDELTAYHEAGHACMAIMLGGSVCRLTIEPEWDDGPDRCGDTQVIWPVRRFSSRELCLRKAQTALAGPVAEMIYSGNAFHPAFVAPWRCDWQIAAEQLASVAPSPQRLVHVLEETTRQLYQNLRREPVWPAIAALADELLAHQTLEEQSITETIRFWLERGG